MTTSAPTRPVALEELRRAWLAVQAGDFRHPTKARTGTGASAIADVTRAWTPASGERVVPVVGAAGSCGATTVALALATAVEGVGPGWWSAARRPRAGWPPPAPPNSAPTTTAGCTAPATRCCSTGPTASAPPRTPSRPPRRPTRPW